MWNRTPKDKSKLQIATKFRQKIANIVHRSVTLSPWWKHLPLCKRQLSYWEKFLGFSRKNRKYCWLGYDNTGKKVYRLVVGSDSCKEPWSSLLHPIDVSFNDKINFYTLRTPQLTAQFYKYIYNFLLSLDIFPPTYFPRPSPCPRCWYIYILLELLNLSFEKMAGGLRECFLLPDGEMLISSLSTPRRSQRTPSSSLLSTSVQSTTVATCVNCISTSHLVPHIPAGESSKCSSSYNTSLLIQHSHLTEGRCDV